LIFTSKKSNIPQKEEYEFRYSFANDEPDKKKNKAFAKVVDFALHLIKVLGI